MKKKASELKKGDKLNILGKVWEVTDIETSDIGKQGSKKCRLELRSEDNTMAIIRPADYPFEIA